MKARAHASLTEKAYHTLVHKIVTLERPPGSLLAEKELMKDLSIGRTPIREAIQRLIAEGLVKHIPHRGMLVAEIGAFDIEQIYEFRAQLEGFASRLAATRMTADQLAELTRIHDVMDRALADYDLESFIVQDRLFHRLLARGARNRYLEDVLGRLYNQHLRLWYYLFKKRDGLTETVHQHQELIGALLRREADESEMAMKMYVSRLARRIKEVI